MASWVMLLLAAVAYGGLMFGAGMKVESNSRDAKELRVEREANEKYRELEAEKRATAEDISKELSRERQLREFDSVKFRDEVRNARQKGIALASCPEPSTIRVPRPLVQVEPGTKPKMPIPTEPGPVATVERTEPRFTSEFARLHDLALGAHGVPDPANTGRVDGGSAPAGFVDAETVLDVHAANAIIARECRSKLGQWQNLARLNRWVGQAKPKE